MELIVSIPNSLFAKLDAYVEDGTFSHRRELVESALEYFLHAHERGEVLALKSPDELSADERSEQQAFLAAKKQIDLQRRQPEHQEN